VYTVLFKKIVNRTPRLKVPFIMDDFILQVTQLLRAEFKELMDVAQAIFKDIKPCDKEW